MDNSIESEQLFNLFDTLLEYNYNYYNDPSNDELREECSSNINSFQNILLKNYNYLKIVDNLSDYIDNKIQEYKDLNFIIILFNNVFSNDLIELIINLKYDDQNKCIYHYNICMILIIKMTLYYKYAEEELQTREEAEELLKYVLPDIFEFIKVIFNDIKNDNDLIEQKERLMELLCSFDLEDIYTQE